MKDLYKKAIEVFGEKEQTMVAAEEFAELTQIIMRATRGNRKVKREEITTEIADALIMIEQLKLIFKISDKEVKEEMQLKQKKLKYYIGEEKCIKKR